MTLNTKTYQGVFLADKEQRSRHPRPRAGMLVCEHMKYWYGTRITWWNVSSPGCWGSSRNDELLGNLKSQWRLIKLAAFRNWHSCETEKKKLKLRSTNLTSLHWAFWSNEQQTPGLNSLLHHQFARGSLRTRANTHLSPTCFLPSPCALLQPSARWRRHEKPCKPRASMNLYTFTIYLSKTSFFCSAHLLAAVVCLPSAGRRDSHKRLLLQCTPAAEPGKNATSTSKKTNFIYLLRLDSAQKQNVFSCTANM